jgi:hypothetical protein
MKGRGTFTHGALQAFKRKKSRELYTSHTATQDQGASFLDCSLHDWKADVILAFGVSISRSAVRALI